MKPAILLSILGLGLLTGCATAYKNGQTPDDLYYSPGRPAGEVTQDRLSQREDQAYEAYQTGIDDQYLRMKVANRYRWDMLDDFDYWYDSRYDFSYSNYNYYLTNPYASWNPQWYLNIGYGSPYYPWGYSWGWNSPIYTLVHYAIPSYGYGGSTSGSNISAFRNRSYQNSNLGYFNQKTGQFTTSGSNNSFSNLLRRVFTTTAPNGTVNTFDRPVRTFTPSSSTTPPMSSSAGGNSGGYKSTGSSSSSGRGGRGG